MPPGEFVKSFFVFVFFISLCTLVVYIAGLHAELNCLFFNLFNASNFAQVWSNLTQQLIAVMYTVLLFGSCRLFKSDLFQ